MYRRYINKFIYLSLYLSKSGSGRGAAMWAVLHLDNGARLLVGVRRHVQQDLESPQDLHQQKDSAHGKPRSIDRRRSPTFAPSSMLPLVAGINFRLLSVNRAPITPILSHRVL